ncbi:hypothetical protein [Nocardia seriolae]|uniref:hypothetical protein n=2 Tax=Nocardia seriolae TaxID=37332 RepID=UPI001160D02A|nr:hypothetical protein [Nocardia seriolae]QOW35997.1 hypothetical protein IMZ23_14490 [Nocardia seriolae]QUN16505.1 hypothetical protein KEC46_30455 [Nocardia seriolae]WKY49940.1 hypothetical protein Q5P07_23000 [Nocardia seriolae]WNJ56426.1 hypothetical protein RMO66_23290 [Nocardia seriolae]
MDYWANTNASSKGHEFVIGVGVQGIVEQDIGQARHQRDRVGGRDVVENDSLHGHASILRPSHRLDFRSHAAA